VLGWREKFKFERGEGCAAAVERGFEEKQRDSQAKKGLEHVTYW